MNQKSKRRSEMILLLLSLSLSLSLLALQIQSVSVTTIRRRHLLALLLAQQLFVAAQSSQQQQQFSTQQRRVPRIATTTAVSAANTNIALRGQCETQWRAFNVRGGGGGESGGESESVFDDNDDYGDYYGDNSNVYGDYYGDGKEWEAEANANTNTNSYIDIDQDTSGVSPMENHNPILILTPKQRTEQIRSDLLRGIMFVNGILAAPRVFFGNSIGGGGGGGGSNKRKPPSAVPVAAEATAVFELGRYIVMTTHQFVFAKLCFWLSDAAHGGATDEQSSDNNGNNRQHQHQHQHQHSYEGQGGARQVRVDITQGLLIVNFAKAVLHFMEVGFRAIFGKRFSFGILFSFLRFSKPLLAMKFIHNNNKILDLSLQILFFIGEMVIQFGFAWLYLWVGTTVRRVKERQQQHHL